MGRLLPSRSVGIDRDDVFHFWDDGWQPDFSQRRSGQSDHRLSVVGSVAFRDEGDLRADDGAVIMLLPKDQKPDVRAGGAIVNPDTFQALDNIAIDRVHELGGAIVRADENGQFDVVIDGNEGPGIEYYLLIVSKHQRGVDSRQMTKEEFASIGTYFSPVEDLVEDRSFFWMKLVAGTQRIDLPEIEF